MARQLELDQNHWVTFFKLRQNLAVVYGSYKVKWKIEIFPV